VETLELVPYDSVTGRPRAYDVNFGSDQQERAGVRYRLGTHGLSGPIALKTAVTEEALPRLRRELDVAKYFRGDARYFLQDGGELLSKCLAYDFTGTSPRALVTRRGQRLADIARSRADWPFPHAVRAKLTLDLLLGLEILRKHSIVHGAIGMDTLTWDGGTLQITDFGHAALGGQYPDGSAAHHGDDIDAACRVIYRAHAGTAPPEDPAELRHQVEMLDDGLRKLLLRSGGERDLYYAFDAVPDRRPSSRNLLDVLDDRPNSVQLRQLRQRDAEVRAGFRRLRERQRQYRSRYESWDGQPDVPEVASEQPATPRRTPYLPPRTQYPSHQAASQASVPGWPSAPPLEPAVAAPGPPLTLTVPPPAVAHPVPPAPPPPAPSFVPAPPPQPTTTARPAWEPVDGPAWADPGRSARPARAGTSRIGHRTGWLVAVLAVLAVLVVLAVTGLL
jgi:hypothetical protein